MSDYYCYCCLSLFLIDIIVVVIQTFQIDVEDLAKIPIHLMARLVQYNPHEMLFRYVLSGISLLRNLYEIAPQHSKLEQVIPILFSCYIFR